MPENSNKLSQFWQELRRRKVIRVISVYAAAAFVILELTDIVAPSLGLPAWTLNFIIILLGVGFVITVILSWIFDIHPGEGIVKTEAAEKEKPGRKPSASMGWKIASYISLLVIVVLLILNIIPDKQQSGESEVLDRSIAVLPFQNLSEEEGNEHFVDGLVEDLLNRISVIEDLRVISRTSSDMYRERGLKSVPEIASELNVSYIVEGSVQRYGNKARITVQLIDARSDHHLWAKNYDRDLVDVFQTQSEIAMKIALEFKAILSAREEAQIQKSRTKNVQAFEYYQMGRFYWYKRTGEGFSKSIEYFEKAIKADPEYGLAYAGLADAYNLMAIQGWIDGMEGRDKAVKLATYALELDENLAEAYTVLGSIYDYVDFEWEKAEQAFERALEINPNYSTAHHYYAEHLSILGFHDQARRHIDKAIELDPLQFVKRYVSAKLYMNQGQIPEALQAIDRGNELYENHPWVAWIRLMCYWKLNEENRAYDAFITYYAADPKYNIEKADSIFSEFGFQGVMEWKIQMELQDIETSREAYTLARWYAMAGYSEEALYWLDQAWPHDAKAETGSIIYFHHLHQDPRFLAILAKMGLDKYPVYGQQLPSSLPGVRIE
jgi:TolB-like protein